MTIETMATWEEMSDLEQAQCIYWDMYKSAHNFRPRGIDFSNWTLENFKDEFKSLSEVIKKNGEDRDLLEAKSIKTFESRMTEMMSSQNISRKDALRWIHQAEETNDDDEYLCYTLCLPYMYFAS